MNTPRDIVIASYLQRARDRATLNGIQIPKWVPYRLHAEFVDCALAFGEEQAASHIRKLKRELCEREHHGEVA